MPITYVGAGAVVTGQDPLVPVPSGILEGDLLIIAVTAGNTVPNVSGWTRVINQNANRFLTIYTKTATASESSVLIDNLQSDRAKAVMVAYRGSTNSLVDISTFSTGTSTSPVTNSVTTTINGLTVVSFYGINNTTTSNITAPASTTSRVNSGSTNNGFNGLLLVDEVQAVAGATTQRTATLSASNAWAAVSFTLREVRDLYWVGGSGTWDASATGNWALTSNGTSGAAAPTAIDNVFIDTSSGTGTITCTGAVCNNITVTASQAIILGAASSTLSVFGNLTFPSGGSFSASTNTNTITFAATTTGETITTNGKSLATVVFDGVGGGWTLGSNLTTTGSITLTRGTFDTSSSGNYSITCTVFNSTNATARTLNLNASTVTLNFNGAAFVWNCATSTNLTINAGTSTISVSTGQPAFAGGGRTYNNLVFTNTTASPITISGVNTFNNLTFTSRTTDGVGSITIDANQTVTGTLTLGTSNTAVRRFLVASSAVGTARTLTVATIATLSDVDFRDITAAGASGTWSGTRLGNCLGNTNITFNAGKTVYWNLAGTQSWSAVGWATTNNGTPALNNFPLAQDTAVFTEAGSAGTISIQGAWHVGTIQMADGISNRTTTFTLAFNSPINLYGSFIAFSGLNVISPNSLGFRGQGVTQDFNSAGVSFSTPLTINNTTGTLRLLSDLTTTNSITLTNGTFNANGYNVTATTYSTSGTTSSRATVMGNGLWTLTGTGNVWNINSSSDTVTKGTSDIVLSNTTTTSRTFFSGGFTYNKLTIGGSTGTSTLNISSGVGLSTTTFSEIASTKTVAHTIAFGDAITIETWSVSGSSGNVVTVNSSIPGTTRTLTITNKTTAIDYLAIQDITSANSNPITFWAGANSTNNGNNTNVVFADGASTSAYVLTTSVPFVAPADWNDSNNAIYLFGGGGGGSGSGSGTGSWRTGGAGGGGGAYTKLSNVSLTPSTSYTIAIGAGGAGGASRNGTNGVSTAGTGGSTTFNDGSNTYTANGGLGGSIATNVPSSTGGAGGTAQTVSGLITQAFAGGNGGNGGVNTASNPNSGGGGGGAGGVNGVGGAGGNGISSSTTNLQAGGGGGNGGGTAGGIGIAGFGGGAGGNNSLGLGGGAARTSQAVGAAGTVGGGGSGGTGAALRGGIGGSGADILGGLGSGGGSGGSTNALNTLATAGLYGGGAGGSGNAASSVFAGIAGAQGAIIVVYSLTNAPTSSNFLLFF